MGEKVQNSNLSYGFYNSKNGDRTYNAMSVGRLFDGLIKDGVFAGEGEQFRIVLGTLEDDEKSANAGAIIVKPGKAWFNHTWTHLDSDLRILIPKAVGGQERYDKIYLTINRNVEAQGTNPYFRENYIEYQRGTQQAPPAPIPNIESYNSQWPVPSSGDYEGIYRYALGYVHVSGTANLTSADIFNLVGSTPTPYVTGVAQSMNVDSIKANLQQLALNWFQTFKSDNLSKIKELIGDRIDEITSFSTWYSSYDLADTPENGDYCNYKNQRYRRRWRREVRQVPGGSSGPSVTEFDPTELIGATNVMLRPKTSDFIVGTDGKVGIIIDPIRYGIDGETGYPYATYSYIILDNTTVFSFLGDSGDINNFVPRSAQAAASSATTQPVSIDSNGKLWVPPAPDITDVLVKAEQVPKVVDMTEPVGVDEYGQLWVRPSAEGGSGENNLVYLSMAYYDGTYYIDPLGVSDIYNMLVEEGQNVSFILQDTQGRLCPLISVPETEDGNATFATYDYQGYFVLYYLDSSGTVTSDTVNFGNYTKPYTGIPETDLAFELAVKINNAYVKPGTGIPEAHLDPTVAAKLGTFNIQIYYSNNEYTTSQEFSDIMNALFRGRPIYCVDNNNVECYVCGSAINSIDFASIVPGWGGTQPTMWLYHVTADGVSATSVSIGGGGSGSNYPPSGGIPESDLSDALAAKINGKGTYSKPSGGIPKSDLATAVQTSLGKADTAIQPTDSPIIVEIVKNGTSLGIPNTTFSDLYNAYVGARKVAFVCDVDGYGIMTVFQLISVDLTSHSVMLGATTDDVVYTAIFTAYQSDPSLMVATLEETPIGGSSGSYPPSGGIPESDLSTALANKINSKGTYSKPSGGIPVTDLSEEATPINVMITWNGSSFSVSPRFVDISDAISEGRPVVVGVDGVAHGWLSRDDSSSIEFCIVDASQHPPQLIVIVLDDSNGVSTDTCTLGDAVAPVVSTPAGATPSFVASNNYIYECGECTSLTVINYPANGEFVLIFTSGSTPTSLTLPQTIEDRLPSNFSVEANTRYEISVRKGWPLVASWEVAAS